MFSYKVGPRKNEQILSCTKKAIFCVAEKAIRSVALCAGSGTSVLKGVQADLYLTGEMLHHDVLDAVIGGETYVILTNHSDSERGFFRDFATTLSGMLENQVVVSVSKADADPLKTV